MNQAVANPEASVPGGAVRVGGQMVGRRGWIPALLLPAFVLVSASLVGGEEEKPSVGTLRGYVRQLIDLQVAAGDEENRWQEEKAHLETTFSLLDAERAVLEERLASANAEEDTTAAECERLAAWIERGQSLLCDVDDATVRCAKRLFDVFEGLPAPLGESLARGAARVRGARSAVSGSAGALDRLRLAAAFASDLDRTSSSVHVVKEMLDVDGTGAREMDVLYLGAAVGYWVGPDAGQSGLVIRGEGGWKVIRRDELAAEILQTIAILGKEEPASLVHLPLSFGGER